MPDRCSFVSPTVAGGTDDRAHARSRSTPPIRRNLNAGSSDTRIPIITEAIDAIPIESVPHGFAGTQSSVKDGQAVHVASVRFA